MNVKPILSQFQAADHKVFVNKNPAQIHEYLSGSQKSNAVTAAWNLQGEPPSKMTGKMVPHMRAALVEKVAATLRDFLVGHAFRMLAYTTYSGPDHTLARVEDARDPAGFSRARG